MKPMQSIKLTLIKLRTSILLGLFQLLNVGIFFSQLEKVEFTFIGPEWGDEGDANGGDHGDGNGEGNNGAAAAAGNSHGGGGDKKPKSATQLEGEEMVGELVSATEGLMCTMEVQTYCLS